MMNSATQVRLQDTLGPSHVLFHSASLGTLHLTVFLRYIITTSMIVSIFILIIIIIILFITIRRDLIWYCSIPEDDSFSTRPGAQFKTKVHHGHYDHHQSCHYDISTIMIIITVKVIIITNFIIVI